MDARQQTSAVKYFFGARSHERQPFFRWAAVAILDAEITGSETPNVLMSILSCFGKDLLSQSNIEWRAEDQPGYGIEHDLNATLSLRE